jgi:HTH DNA binding domain
MLRRLVLELPANQNDGVKRKESSSGKVESLEMLHLLRSDKNEYTAICRMEFNDDDAEEFLAHSSLTEFQVIDQEKGGAFIVYVKGTQPSLLSDTLGPIMRSAGVHMFDLFELRDKKFRISFLGSATKVSDFLKRLEKSKIEHTLLSLTDARFSADSPLFALTEKQRQTLISAFRLGYFRVPRLITSEKLAKRLGISSSTVGEHLRKAEGRLISRLLE